MKKKIKEPIEEKEIKHYTDDELRLLHNEEMLKYVEEYHMTQSNDMTFREENGEWFVYFYFKK
jgi:hypothetical protein